MTASVARNPQPLLGSEQTGLGEILDEADELQAPSMLRSRWEWRVVGDVTLS